ncbi:etoposide-induced protein 2.4 homolog isoform X2 [Homarus americanus]|uniref:Etoposide-induced protein 2.4-like n=1 Tax=Homarus americanus TaxID=6706 RepID=A0A8J5MR37_HOMAM|nr:etoposide-induced protein 2.4 homolog isoform X2 [Homarus americanus]KAG7160282.1 Etoposide-induced protein 2.4-like [Homarus americanus]
MDSLKLMVYGFLRGVRDSFAGFVLIFRYDADAPKKPRASPVQETNLAKRRAAQQAEKKQKQASQKDETKVTHRILQCCVLNGAVFGLSLVIFNYILLPGLKQVLGLFLDEGAGAVWQYVRPTLTAVFNMLWVLPLFVLSRIINTIWFQDIADSAYRQRQGRPQLISSISKLVADVLISIFIQLLFLIQANLVMLLPLVGIGVILSGVHMCMLNALYAFEYRWFNMGWELYKRLSFIEENWPYFMGFGLPLAIITMYPSSVYTSGCLFALLFPVFIISANEADPVLNPNGYQMQLFSVVVGVSNRIIQTLVTRRPPQTPGKTPQPSPYHSAATRPARH